MLYARAEFCKSIRFLTPILSKILALKVATVFDFKSKCDAISLTLFPFSSSSRTSVSRSERFVKGLSLFPFVALCCMSKYFD